MSMPPHRRVRDSHNRLQHRPGLQDKDVVLEEPSIRHHQLPPVCSQTLRGNLRESGIDFPPELVAFARLCSDLARDAVNGQTCRDGSVDACLACAQAEPASLQNPANSSGVLSCPHRGRHAIPARAGVRLVNQRHPLSIPRAPQEDHQTQKGLHLFSSAWPKLDTLPIVLLHKPVDCVEAAEHLARHKAAESRVAKDELQLDT